MVNVLSYVAVLLFILLVVSLCIDENSKLVLLTSILCIVVVVIVGYKMYDGYTYLRTTRGILISRVLVIY